MIAAQMANGDRRVAHARAASVQTYARIAGVLFLISILAGGFGEFFVPSKLIVSGDATSTANNIMASGSLFSIVFACYLVEPGLLVSLPLIVYIFFSPAQNVLPLRPAIYRIVFNNSKATAE